MWRGFGMVEKLFRGHPPGEHPCTAIPSLSVVSAKSVVSTAFSVDGAWICYRPVNSEARSELARNLQSDLRSTHNRQLIADHKATRGMPVKSQTAEVIIPSVYSIHHSDQSPKEQAQNAAILGLAHHPEDGSCLLNTLSS